MYGKKWHKLCSGHFDWCQFEQNPGQMNELSKQTGENHFGKIKKGCCTPVNTTAIKGPELQSKIRTRLPEKVRGAYQKSRRR